MCMGGLRTVDSRDILLISQEQKQPFVMKTYLNEDYNPSEVTFQDVPGHK